MNIETTIKKLFEGQEPQYTYVLKKWLSDPKAFAKVSNPEDFVEGEGIWFVKALKIWYSKNKLPPTHDDLHKMTVTLMNKGMPRYLLADLMDLVDKLVPHKHDPEGEDIRESDAPDAWQYQDGSCQCHDCAKRRYGNRLMTSKSLGIKPMYDLATAMTESADGKPPKKVLCKTCRKDLLNIEEKVGCKKKTIKKKLREAVEDEKEDDEDFDINDIIDDANDDIEKKTSPDAEDDDKIAFNKKPSKAPAKSEGEDEPEAPSDDVDSSDMDAGNEGDYASWSPKKNQPGVSISLNLTSSGDSNYQWKLDMIDRSMPYTVNVEGEVDKTAQELMQSIVKEYKRYEARVMQILEGFGE